MPFPFSLHLHSRSQEKGERKSESPLLSIVIVPTEKEIFFFLLPPSLPFRAICHSSRLSAANNNLSTIPWNETLLPRLSSVGNRRYHAKVRPGWLLTWPLFEIPAPPPPQSLLVGSEIEREEKSPPLLLFFVAQCRELKWPLSSEKLIFQGGGVEE